MSVFIRTHLIAQKRRTSGGQPWRGMLIAAVWAALTVNQEGASPTVNWEFPAGIIETTPAIGTDGTVYVGTSDHFSANNRLYALNPDGTEKWQVPSARPFSTSPVVGLDGSVYIASADSHLYAFADDGSERWRFETGDLVYGAPAVAADGTLYFGSLQGIFYAVQPDGTGLWEEPIGSAIGAGALVTPDGTVYVGTSERFSGENRLMAFQADGTSIWETVVGGAVEGLAVGIDGSIYVATSDFQLLAVGTDGGLEWTFPVGGGLSSPPVVAADGTVYIGTLEGRLFALDSEGHLKWSLESSAAIPGSPAIDANGSIYYGARDGHFFALDPDGSVEWEFETSSFFGASPVLSEQGELIFGVGAGAGRVYSIRAGVGPAASPWPMWGANPQHTGRSGPVVPKPPPPVIAVQPVDQTVFVGQSTALFVLAVGEGPFSYQWFHNGSPMAGETGPILGLTNVQVSQQGVYEVEIENAGGTVRSAPVELVVDPFGESPEFEWVARIGGEDADVGRSIAVGPDGSVFVTGTVQGTVRAGDDIWEDTATTAFVAKYSAGGDLLWFKRAGGSPGGFSGGRGVAVNAEGDVFVVGSFSGTMQLADVELASTDFGALFIARYSGSGELSWAKQVEATGIGRVSGRGVALDSSSRCYVTGEFAGAVDFGVDVSRSATGASDAFLACYDGSGDLVWVRTGGSNTDASTADASAEGGTAVAVGADGKVWMAGAIRGLALFDHLEVGANGTAGIFIAQYDSEGLVQWVRAISGDGELEATGVAVDSSGQGRLCGWFEGSVPFGASVLESTAASRDVFVSGLDADGGVLWAVAFGGDGSDRGLGIALGNGGESFVTGAFLAPARFGSVQIDSGTETDLFLVKLTPDGDVEWFQRGQGGSADEGRAVAVDADGASYLTGLYFSDPWGLGDEQLHGGQRGDTFVAKVMAASGPNLPLVLVPPQRVKVPPSTDTAFAVGVRSASPVTYQWQLNQRDLEGATDPYLILLDVGPEDVGAYRVKVANAAGAVFTPAAVLELTTEVPLMAALSGANVLPPVAGAGSGLAQFRLLDGVLSYEVDFAGLAGTALGAEIRGPATEETAGEVVASLTADGNLSSSGRFAGSVSLSRSRTDELVQGLHYVLIRSSAFPLGELRGQIRPGSNATPFLSYIPAQRVLQGTDELALEFTVGDAETPATALQITATSSNSEVVVGPQIRIEGTGAQRRAIIPIVDSALGTTRIVLAVLDAAGRPFERSFALTVDRADLLVEVGEVGGASGGEAVVPVRVHRFVEVTGLQLSMHWDHQVVEFLNAEGYSLSGLNDDHFGVAHAGEGVLTLSWDNPNAEGSTLPNGAPAFALRFRVLGELGEMSDVTVDGSPTPMEASGRELSSIPISVQAGAVIVSPPEVQLTGRVYYYFDGKPIPAAQVRLQGDNLFEGQTDADGNFGFSPHSGGSFDLTVGREGVGAPSAGVTSLDLVIIRRHILGLERLESPFEFLAADANQSESVTTLDIILLRRVILGLDPSPPAGLWRFIPSDTEFPDPTNPWDAPAPARSYPSLTQDRLDQDFIGIKIGDVNGSWEQ